MEIQGTIKVITDEQVFGTKGFKKRTLVITTDDRYPQHIPIDFVQEGCNILNNYREGDVIEVKINLRGREWVSPNGEVKYFGSIQGWAIKELPRVLSNTQQPKQNETITSDDLPF